VRVVYPGTNSLLSMSFGKEYAIIYKLKKAPFIAFISVKLNQLYHSDTHHFNKYLIKRWQVPNRLQIY